MQNSKQIYIFKGNSCPTKRSCPYQPINFSSNDFCSSTSSLNILVSKYGGDTEYSVVLQRCWGVIKVSAHMGYSSLLKYILRYIFK